MTYEELMRMYAQAQAMPRGQFEIGYGGVEYPIDFSRPVLRNEDGSFSTEETATFELDGKHHVIPTIYDGKRYPADVALELYRQGLNKSVGVFDTEQEAEDYAVKRTALLGKLRNPDNAWTSYHTFPEAVGKLGEVWYDRLVGSPLAAANRIGAALQGQANPDKEAFQRDVLEALGAYAGPSLIGKPSLTMASTFGGIGARGANKRMLEVAERALAAGKDPDEVRRVTGWFKGMDGKPRFEIDDSKFKVNFTHQPSTFRRAEGEYHNSGVLEDILDHEKLYSQYPELRKLEVNYYISPGNERKGLFSAEVSATGKIKPYIEIRSPDVETAKDTLTHEIQHWIQRKEGFARGGNQYRELERLQSEGGFLNPEVPQDVTLPEFAFKRYQRLAGEIEARDAAGRRTWDMDMRREVPPTLRDDAIIRMGNPDLDEFVQQVMMELNY